jgi:hypothetical protein
MSGLQYENVFSVIFIPWRRQGCGPRHANLVAMLWLGLVAVFLVTASPLPPSPQASGNPVPVPQNTHWVGERLNYSLQAVMSQSIRGRDPFGRTIHQILAPTRVRGRESIAVTASSASSLTLHRLGSVTAVVDGAKPQRRWGHGWTLLNASGILVRDTGNLGGLFLLPLPFMGWHALDAGRPLAVGDSWSGKLGAKLYGMTAQPLLHFTVTGERSVLGVNVFTIHATGSVPMKEPALTSSGEPLGWATGIAHISATFDYDPLNCRLISMQAQLQDTLHYKGPGKHVTGIVQDVQRTLVALDAASMASGERPAVDPTP